MEEPTVLKLITKENLIIAVFAQIELYHTVFKILE